MQRIVVEDRLRQFIKDYCDGRCSVQLLLFLGRHPHARFSQLAMVHAMDARKSDVEAAVRHLIDKRLVIEWTAENGFPFYSLTGEEPLAGMVQELMALDWWQHKFMLEGI